MEAGFMHHFALWVAALLTLGIVSFLYRDNVWYKICEAVFVGISAGYWLVTYFWDNLYSKFGMGVFVERSPGSADWWMLIFGGLLGLLMLMRLFPKIGWISRWPLAFIVGATAGLYLVVYFASNVMLQIEDTLRPLFGEQGTPWRWDEAFGNIIVFCGTLTGLVYFFFSKEHTGTFGRTAKIGIFFLMITFGASFGFTVMSRMSLLIGRIDFLLHDWLGLVQ